MKIRNLRTNHLENPLGYRMEKPLLTWTAEDSTGACQRAARVYYEAICRYFGTQPIAQA